MATLIFLFPLLLRAQATPDAAIILGRIGLAAEVFRKVAPTTVSEERLEQRSPPRTAGAAPEEHEVISVYGYAALNSAPNALHEVRKVISVDGRQVTAAVKAREAMSLGLSSSDDKLKKRLLEDFEQHGLRGAATDFGQIILLFTTAHLRDYRFQYAGEKQVGPDLMQVITFQQTTGAGGVTIFRANQAKREPLSGAILVRKRDGMPLRVITLTIQKVQNNEVRDEATVDYSDGEFGSILPTSVVHREYVGKELVTENSFFYSTFHKLQGSRLSIEEKP